MHTCQSPHIALGYMQCFHDIMAGRAWHCTGITFKSMCVSVRARSDAHVAHLVWRPLHGILMSIVLPPDLQWPEELEQGWLKWRLFLQVGCTVFRFSGVHMGGACNWVYLVSMF